MSIITTQLTARATRSMWLAEWQESPSIPRWTRPFLPFLSRFLGPGGRFSWTSIKVVIQQWGVENGRRYTQRWILKLLAAITESGAIQRVIHSAPGQPAVYRAVIPGHPGYRPVSIRPRGITPKRLLASFRKEKDYEQSKEATPQVRGSRPRPARANRLVGGPRPAEREGPTDGGPVSSPRLQSRHAGCCPRCREPYRPGDWITRYPEGWGHLDCAEAFLGGL